MRFALTYSFVILAFGAGTGCSTRPMVDKHTIAPTAAAGAIEGRPTLGLPIPIPGQTTYLVPFSVETEKGWFQDSDPFTKGGYAPASPAASVRYASQLARASSVRWHNALAFDLKTGEQWAILSRRGVISSYQFLGRPTDDGKAFNTDAVFFLAVVEDSNKDGSLNDKDAAVVILTGPDGRDPRIVSPADAQVWGTSYDVRSRHLFLLVVTDTNHDGVFDTKDSPAPYMIDVGRRDMARPVASEAAVQALEGLLK